MQQSINASIPQFNFLIHHPKAWQVLGLVSWGLKKNDEIKYIEVDSLNVPTGRERIGVVFWIGGEEFKVTNLKETIYYCQDIQTGIGEAIVGRSLIVG